MASHECCRAAPAAEHVVQGRVEKIGNSMAYMNGEPSSDTPVIVLVSDIFGFEAPLLRKLADKCAAQGYFVVVPDFFNGDPVVIKDPKDVQATLGAWRAKHPPTDLTDAKVIIKVLREQGIKSVGAGGFCWGGKLVTELAKEDSPVINACVLLHPSAVTKDDIQNVKVPIAILASEIDQQTPPELAEEFRVILYSRPEAESFVKVFRGMKHGWTVRYDVNNAEEVKSALEAQDDMLDWFKRFL